MDLFHAITQSIDTVLTCHWFEEVKKFNMSHSNSSNSSMMDTEPGGESTQYESIKTVTKPPKKEEGELSGSSSDNQTGGNSVSDERGEKTASNIRYGQAISEGGFGGQTNTSSETQQEGYGGTEADSREEGVNAGASRRAQGYAGSSGVGA